MYNEQLIMNNECESRIEIKRASPKPPAAELPTRIGFTNG
jgi:hypothetical protein